MPADFPSATTAQESPQATPGGTGPKNLLDLADSSWDRFVALSDSVDLLSAMLRGDDRLAPLLQSRKSVGEQLARLRKLDPQSESFGECVRTLDRDLTSATRAFLTTEAELPMPVFRQAFHVERHPESVIVHYVRTLLEEPDGHKERRDRIEFVLTRLLTGRNLAGLIDIRPRADVEALMDQVSRGHRASAEARESGLHFFRAAINRLDELSTFESLFDSGFYLDTRGYKISLRDDLFDPDLLYIVCELNAAISNKLTAVLSEGAVPREAIVARFDELEKKLQTIFGGQAADGHDPFATKFERNREPDAAPSKKRALFFGRFKVPALPSINPRIVLGIIALFGFSALFFTKTMRNENKLRPVEPSQLGALSDILEEGSFSVGTSQRIFVGKVRNAEWTMKTRSERKKIGNEIKEQLVSRGVRAGLVLRDTQLVIQIDDGLVVFVD